MSGKMRTAVRSSTLLGLGSKLRRGRETWTIGAVGTIEGERYYWLTNRAGVVSMEPACVVEKRPNDPKLSEPAGEQTP